jgi:chloramphenicol-sensitive protein RarD
MQYIAPSMHFLMAVYVWGEPLDQAKLLTLPVMIWIALVVFTFDSWRNARNARKAQQQATV